MSKKGKRNKKAKSKGEITVTASPRDYAEAGACCSTLALWACSAFSMEPTAENARAIYALAWSRAGEHVEVERFAKDPIEKR